MTRSRRPLRAVIGYLGEHGPGEVFGKFGRRIASIGRPFAFVGRTVASIGRRVAEPFTLSIVLGALLTAGGLALVGLAWNGASRTLVVALQLAYFASGALGGLALVIFGVGILHGQGSRRLTANELHRMESLRNEAARVLEALSSRS